MSNVLEYKGYQATEIEKRAQQKRKPEKTKELGKT
jgi:hypothetical protein